MRSIVVGGVLLFAACSHPQNLERKDALNDQVSGAMQPTARVFLKDDPAARVSCRADGDCPRGALCHPQRNVCFTGAPEMEMTKLDANACPLVPLYFEFDSTELVAPARAWVSHDARCLRDSGAERVVLTGFADVRGDPAYNVDLSRRRAEAVKAALKQRGVDVPVVVRGEGATRDVGGGTSEHDLAYNRRVELESK